MRWRYWLCAVFLSILALICLFDGSGELRLGFDPTTESLIDTKTIDTGKTAELLVLFRRNSPWDSGSILAVDGLLASVGDIPGVVTLESPVTARLPRIDGEDIYVQSLAQRIRDFPEEAGHWIEWTFADPLMEGRLVNTAYNDVAARIQLLRADLDRDEKLLDSVLARLDQFDQGHTDISVHVTGAPVVDRDISEILVDDLIGILILSGIIVPLVLILAFTHLAAILLMFLTIALAVLWTLAGMVLMGIPINLVTAVVPPIIVGLTLAYGMHAIFGCMHMDSDNNAWRRLLGPFIATGVTTIAALLALYLQPVPAIRQFSLAGAFGVFSGLLAIMLLMCLGGRSLLARTGVRSWLDSLLARVAAGALELVRDNRTAVLVLSILVLILAVISASSVTPGARFMSDLPDDNRTRQNFEVINSSLGGGNGFRIVLSGAGEDAILLPGVLKAADSLQTWLQNQPEVGRTTSLVDYIKRLNQIFHFGREDAYAIPENMFVTKQLLVIAATSEAERYTNLDNSMMVIRVQTPLDETADLTDLIHRIDTRLEQLPTGISAELKGDAVTLVRTIEQLTTGQLKSLALAVTAIYVVISLLFASFRMGLRAMLPNLLPIATFYGLLGLTGIHLSPAMALVSCLVIGIAVDDTMFYLVRFNHAARKYADEKRGAEIALRETIQPVTLTTIVLCLCFLTVSSGQFESQAMFGILAAATLAVAWLCDITVTPAIGIKSSIVTLWEVLNVDLGRKPQEAIPLMRGMSARQARLFALLTHMQGIKAGTQFIFEGDEAQDMFVIVNGQARVWVRRGESETELARFSRGHIIGEMSAFVHHRTANVTAVTDLQVLVFDPKRLDRIRRWHPRIAALVYRNLNQIQAERLENTTRELNQLRAGG